MKIFYKVLAMLAILSVSFGVLTGCEGLSDAIFGTSSDGGHNSDAGENAGNGGGNNNSDSDNSNEESSDSKSEEDDNSQTGGDDGSKPEEDDNSQTGSDDGSSSDKDYTSDPYADMTAEEFYSDYEPAECYLDAYYRSLHCFMSGSLDEQDQYQTFAEYRPMQDGKYIRNTAALYTEDGKGYHIVDGYGNIVNTVYKGGAYVTLEEVAAYVFAFGDIPMNYTSSKKTKPTESGWGEYLRLNHTKFSGNTSKYPYEPVLPRISGCGGDLQYYEIDIGTTGTTCDPSYNARVYNDGRSITRGAARIVYTRFYYSGGFSIMNTEEKYVFYTYNHYNDFSEYLNYEGGWGEIFGNITGGGTISSKYDYNPTPYVKTARADFTVNVSVLFVALVDFGKLKIA